MRCDEPGWIQVAMQDMRRGVWMRHTATALEFCFGREGDDSYVVLRAGEVADAATLARLSDLIATYSEWCPA